MSGVGSLRSGRRLWLFVVVGVSVVVAGLLVRAGSPDGLSAGAPVISSVPGPVSSPSMSPNGSWRVVLERSSVGGPATAVWRSPDGVTWTRIVVPSGTTAQAAVGVDDSGVVTLARRGDVVRYVAGVWQSPVSVYAGSFGYVGPIAVVTNSTNTVAAVVLSDGAVVSSADGWVTVGVTFDQPSGSASSASAIGDVVFVSSFYSGPSGVLQRWSFTSQSWLPVASAPYGFVSVASVVGSTTTLWAAASDNGNQVAQPYVTSPGLGVWKSTDAGASWTKVVSEAPMPARYGVFWGSPRFGSDAKWHLFGDTSFDGNTKVSYEVTFDPVTKVWGVPTRVDNFGTGTSFVTFPNQRPNGAQVPIVRWAQTPGASGYDVFAVGAGTTEPFAVTSQQATSYADLVGVGSQLSAPRTSPSGVWSITTDNGPNGPAAVWRTNGDGTWQRIPFPDSPTTIDGPGVNAVGWHAGIAVLDDGTVLAVKREGNFVGSFNVYRFQGGEWFGPLPLALHGSATAPDVVAGANNRVAVLDPSSGVTLSDDGGLTWRFDLNTSLAPPLAGVNGRIVGNVVHGVSPSGYQRWSFIDGTALTVNGLASLPLPARSTLLVDPANSSRVWLADITNGLVLRASTDGGATFAAPTAAEPFPKGMTPSSIQVGSDGRIHLLARAASSSAVLVYSTTHALGSTAGFTPITNLYLGDSGFSELIDSSRLSETSGTPPPVTAWITEPEAAGRTLIRRSNALSSPESVFGSDGYGMSVDGVNAAIGSYATSAKDLAVATVGPALELNRTYNSADQRVGLFGRGWTSTLETRAFENIITHDVVILQGDGRREFFSWNGTGYTPSPGYTSTLVNTGTGWTLTDLDGRVEAFRADGRLTSRTDADGQRQDITWNGSGQPTVVTDVTSGRALILGYTGGFVSSASTTPVTSNGTTAPLTWNYAYTGNLLTKACDPRNNNLTTGYCTTYGYTGGVITSITDPNGHIDQAVGYTKGTVAWEENGAGDRTTFVYTPSRTVSTNERGFATTTDFDSQYRATAVTDPAGGVTAYVYDTAGYRWTTTDANLNVTTRTFDARGNVLSETNGANETTYYTYDANNNLLTVRDGRSTSATDNTYVVTSTWDAARHNKLTETTPTTAQQPTGTTKSWTYTTGTEAAVGGGVMPSGLLRTAVNERGFTTTYSYDSVGNLREVTDPAGLLTSYTYDQLGRRLTQQVFATGFASGVTTSYVYDGLGHVVTQDDPTASNAVTGVVHRKRTVTVFDPAGNKTSVVESDIGGSATPDIARTTLYSYDAADRPWTVTNPEGGVTTNAYDVAGNLIQVTDPRNVVRVTEFNSRNLPTKVTANAVAYHEGATTAHDVIESQTGYDAGGRVTTQTDPLGRVTRIDYDHANRVTQRTLLGYVNRDTTTRDIVVEATVYDKAGNPITVTTSGGLRVENRVFDPANRLITITVDPTGANKVTTNTYDPAGNITTQTITRAGRTEETRFVFDNADRTTSKTVENGTVDLVTSYTYDNRGIKLSETDPRGNLAGATPANFTTNYTLDALGRVTIVTSPPVTAIENGVTTTGVRPAKTYGFDTFNQQVDTKDERGYITNQTFDRLGRVTTIKHPSYTPPGGTALVPTEVFGFDPNGNLTSKTDRRGKTTTYTFDGLNRVRTQTDPAVGAAPAGVVTYVYDDAGNKILQIDQRGAKTRWTYDKLNRQRTLAQEVRQPTLATYTTTYDYDDLGNNTYLQTPAGDVTTFEYSKLSEQTAIVQPGNLRTTTTYDVAGRVTTVTDPLNRKAVTDYDLAGRPTMLRRYNPAGTLLTTVITGYDAAGNQTSIISPRGNVSGATASQFTTTFTYDALNRTLTVVEPTTGASTRTTSYGYDLAGNTSKVTDGRSNATIYVYNAWNVQTTVIEPSTLAHPNAADRTWTTSLDAGGLPVKTVEPGAVTVNRTFDELGRLTVETGSGTGIVTGTRTFSYDTAGFRTSVGLPTGAITLAYDDRGLLLSATGPAGFSPSSFAYDSVGRMTSRTDAAGTVTATWNNRNLPATIVDPLTGQTSTNTWDAAGQLTKITYTAGGTRTIGYDDLGRVNSDQLKTSAGTVTAGYTVGYDVDSNITARTLTLPGNTGAGASTYGYDNAGRLTSWTKPAGTTVAYAYDNAGNLTNNAGTTQTFDERNRMLTSGTNTYTW